MMIWYWWWWWFDGDDDANDDDSWWLMAMKIPVGWWRVSICHALKSGFEVVDFLSSTNTYQTINLATTTFSIISIIIIITFVLFAWSLDRDLQIHLAASSRTRGYLHCNILRGGYITYILSYQTSAIYIIRPLRYITTANQYITTP